eukprot:16896-Heterococcus_DN1.PRE.1
MFCAYSQSINPTVDGCEKVARGTTAHCAAHGGGVRCVISGCNRAAIGKQSMCRVHTDKVNNGDMTIDDVA